jgi:hypothetical protein
MAGAPKGKPAFFFAVVAQPLLAVAAPQNMKNDEIP